MSETIPHQVGPTVPQDIPGSDCIVRLCHPPNGAIPEWNGSEWVAGTAGVIFPYLYDAKGNFVLGADPKTVTGENNQGVGQHALQALTSGVFNVAVGADSMDTVTTASRNVAVGYATLDNSKTGDDNVVVGYGALNTTAAANRSVVIGSGAAELNKGELNDNIIIGYRAARNIKTSGNTIIGFEAPNPEAGNQLIIGVEKGILIEGFYGAGEKYLYIPVELIIKSGATNAQICAPHQQNAGAHKIKTGEGPIEVVKISAPTVENAANAVVRYQASFTINWNATSEGGFTLKLYRDGVLVHEDGYAQGVGATSPLGGIALLQYLQAEAGMHEWEVTAEAYGTECELDLHAGIISVT